MSNCPVGSKIIITNAEEGETYKNGDIFTVNETDGVGVWVSGETVYIASDEFEVYTEPFKVGDKVITTATNSEWGYKLGDRGTVDYIDSHEPKVRLKDAGYHFTEDLKLAEPTPTSHIKVLASNHPREYVVGDILEVSDTNRTFGVEGSIRVTNKHGNPSVVFKGQWEYVAAPVAEPEPLAEWEKELLGVTPRTIAFEGILKGDTIRAEYTQDDVKYITEGIADHLNAGYLDGWVSDAGLWVAAKHHLNPVYTLLERPEPPKPNPFAEAKVGSIATYGEEGTKYLKTGDDAWAPISAKGTLPNYRNSDESMANCGDLIQITYSAP